MEPDLILPIFLPIGYLFLTSGISCCVYHNNLGYKGSYWIDWVLVTFLGPFFLLLWVLIAVGFCGIAPVIIGLKCLLAIFHLPFRCCMKKEMQSRVDYYIIDWPLRKRIKSNIPPPIINNSRQTPMMVIEFV